MIEWLADPTAWLGLFTLIFLEIVLGIDNLIFIAILADKLPPKQRDQARVIGLTLAMVMRLGMLASISWLVTLTDPLFHIASQGFSGRDLILLTGGAFLLFKATMELHERLEGSMHIQGQSQGHAKFWPVVAQIVVLDAVFSIDAVITAVGMVDHLSIMMIAVIISITLMMIASKPLTRFVNAHPTVIMLCLGFLMMIGFSLTAEGLGFHIPKGYLYAAIGFSILIEVFNQIARLRRKQHLQDELSLRERTAYAVMRILGGREVDSHQVGDEIVDMLDDAKADDAVFNRRERIMINGVLQLAERPIKTIMTGRHAIDRINISDDHDKILHDLAQSTHSRILAVKNGVVHEPLGFIHKKELYKEQLLNLAIDWQNMVRTTINLPDSCSILNALEQMRSQSTHIAFVVNEFGDFVGMLTMTDILESIAGELPDASEWAQPISA
ncbi:TerC family protein [Agitococcus lubricus]|uniref:Putative tellurium resistance membrane protein TerC n=1 Tax=Agitococcus lubricus TaxID=1077255 RepID=A0A2T5ISE1_9GAMM|nr:CBS domain-containing protein [Agitococcus lubricus]PTQ86745.1 putative tellurium resistance membrane protein TerC [Agitococcus lubricus]